MVCLSNVYEIVVQSALANLSLIPAANDPAIGSATLQATFGKFRAYLRVSCVEVSTPMFYEDADVAAGGYIGEFIIPLADAIKPPLAMVVLAWLGERLGRSVRLRITDMVAEAQYVEEVETLLLHARQLREEPWTAADDQS
jgi:hypothetical protein